MEEECHLTYTLLTAELSEEVPSLFHIASEEESHLLLVGQSEDEVFQGEYYLLIRGCVSDSNCVNSEAFTVNVILCSE